MMYVYTHVELVIFPRIPKTTIFLAVIIGCRGRRRGTRVLATAAARVFDNSVDEGSIVFVVMLSLRDLISRAGHVVITRCNG